MMMMMMRTVMKIDELCYKIVMATILFLSGWFLRDLIEAINLLTRSMM